MAKVTPISEHFQHFLAEMKQTFLGGFYGQTKLAWQRFFELQPERQRDRFSGCGRYEREARKLARYRNGYYERDFVTRFGSMRLRICPRPGKELSAQRAGTVSAAGGRSLFGPNQRVGSAGAVVLALHPSGKDFVVMSDWIAPKI